MTTSPIAASHHPSHDGGIPARRAARPFVPAPVHNAPMHAAPVRPAEPESEQLVVADAVLQLLRTVNQNAVRRA